MEKMPIVGSENFQISWFSRGGAEEVYETLRTFVGLKERRQRDLYPHPTIGQIA